MPSLTEAEKIDLDGDPQFFDPAEQTQILAAVDFFGAGKPIDVRVSHIGERPGREPLERLIHIRGEARRVVGRVAGIQPASFILVPDKMLPHDEIVNRITGEERKRILEERRIVFHLRTDQNADIVGVLAAKIQKAADIFFEPLRAHSEPGIIAAPLGEQHRRMVGKAEDAQTGTDCPLDVIAVDARRVSATEGMGMQVFYQIHFLATPVSFAARMTAAATAGATCGSRADGMMLVSLTSPSGISAAMA